METHLSATALAKNLSDVLNRVRYRGERFVIERNGEPLGLLAPISANSGATPRELFERLGDLHLPDPEFADDLESVQTAQPMVGDPLWPN